MSSTLAPLLSLLLVPSAFTATPASWDEIDAKVRHETLCQAFVNGATYTFRRKSCSFVGCDEWDYTVKTFCGKGDDGVPTATIEHWKDGSITSREKLSEPNWTELHGNLLRGKAAFTESCGASFYLDGVEATESGQLRASFSIRSGSTLREEGYWVLGDGPTIPQVQERHVVKLTLFREEISDTLMP